MSKRRTQVPLLQRQLCDDRDAWWATCAGPTCAGSSALLLAPSSRPDVLVCPTAFDERVLGRSSKHDIEHARAGNTNGTTASGPEAKVMLPTQLRGVR